VFGKAPVGFDPVDVVFISSELVLMMMNPMMLVTIGYQAVIIHPWAV